MGHICDLGGNYHGYRVSSSIRMKFKLYKDKKKQWRWRLLAKNGRIMADSGESYSRLGKCEHAVQRIISGVPSAKVSFI